ncbi:hypothetical protein PG984_003241 [Apiospora sp. TS-2023a]
MPLAAAALAGTVIAGAAKVAPIPGYGVEEIQWNIEVAPGRMERLNGTAQEVVALAKQINPDFVVPKADPQEAAATAIQRRAAAAGTGNSTAVLAKRNHFLCDIFEGGKAIYTYVINDAIYLQGLQGGPTQGPGPSNCGRVSCEHASSVWICNDAPYTHYFDSWRWIANSVWGILHECFVNQYGIKSLSDGQVFEDGDWNVIVRFDVC